MRSRFGDATFDFTDGEGNSFGMIWLDCKKPMNPRWHELWTAVTPTFGSPIRVKAWYSSRSGEDSAFQHAAELPQAIVENLWRLSHANLAADAVEVVERLLAEKSLLMCTRLTPPPSPSHRADHMTLLAASKILRPGGTVCTTCNVHPRFRGQLDSHYEGAKHINACRKLAGLSPTIAKSKDTIGAYICTKPACQKSLKGLLEAHIHEC